jgi:DNA polymerase I-like protein with 3'-5' exonuclease and polymerase domains
MNRKRFVYDIETNGLIPELDTIHCLVMYDLDSEELLSFRNDGHPDNYARLLEGVKMLADADLRIGHNIINFDERALQKLFPWFPANENGKVLDTIILTRLIWPHIADSDKLRAKRNKLDGRLIGSHSLEAWGQRVGEWKGDYSKELAQELIAQGMSKEEAMKAVWATWSQEMQDYCDQDVTTNLAIYRHCQKRGYASRAVWDEMAMAILCAKIETNGFPFNEAKASALYATLAGERATIEAKLRETFGSWVEKVGDPKKPKSPNKSLGYGGVTTWTFLCGTPLTSADFTKGGLPNTAAKRLGVQRNFDGYPYQPIKIVEFNPTSRVHIANRLTALYGWKPQEFTSDGRPKVDEDIMSSLPYDCGPLLTRYFTVTKRLGQLAEGRQAWLKLVTDGKIHGRYNTVGAVTRRATHSSPNIGQVPSIGAEFGAECRELFGVPDGWIQVGTDASGLELRCLAHYMARWDDGEYGDVILNGDIHTHNQNIAGLPERNMAKTLIYAFLYGGGDGKLGQIVGGSAAHGKDLRARFMSGLPALKNLVDAVKSKAKNHKHLNALDGGALHIRSDHSALNTLLQSAGSLVCKKWLVEMERLLIERGLVHGWDGDFVFMAWVHDEVQVACRTAEVADMVEQAAKDAIKETGRYYGFRVPLDCESKRGLHWKDCH